MTYGHLQADCLYTGISSGPNARCRVWEAFIFYQSQYYSVIVCKSAYRGCQIFGRPFVKRFALCYRTVLCPVLSCPVCLVCDVGVLWPDGGMDQDETWHAGRPRPWPHCVRWGPSSPPQFSAHSCCSQMAGWIKMPLGMEVGLDPCHVVLDGDRAPAKNGTDPPQIPAHVCCGQTAGLIKIPIGTKVGLGPGHTVLHGDPAFPERGTAPNFRPMSIVAKRSPISAMAEYLFI